MIDVEKYNWILFHVSLILLCIAGVCGTGAAAEPTLDNPDPNNLIEWTRRIYTNGQWNATPDIAYWQGHYYVAINQGRFHNGWADPTIVIRSSSNPKVLKPTMAFTVTAACGDAPEQKTTAGAIGWPRGATTRAGPTPNRPAAEQKTRAQ